MTEKLQIIFLNSRLHNNCSLFVMYGMKSIFIIILIFALPVAVFSQISLEPATIDFGLLERSTDRVRDIVISNKGNKMALVLKSNFSDEFDILFSSREIPPDSSIILRIKFKPKRKGKFSENVDLWFSTENKATKISFNADVTYLNPADNTACPNFGDQPYNCCDGPELLVKFFDAETHEPIQARLRIVNQGVLVLDEKADKNMEVRAELPISWYYLEAKATGYLPDDTASYVNTRSNYFELFLQPEKVQQVEVSDSILETDSLHEIQIPNGQDQTSKSLINPVEFAEIDSYEGLPLSTFRRNNIVFLIDVSQSMAGMGKLDLLKSSINELLKSMREIDKVSVITYASDAKVLIARQEGDKHEEIMSAVNGLIAGGLTAGNRGFKMAYEMAQQGFIEGGNNQVIVVTDGAFRASENPKIVEMTGSNLKSGIKTSIVGIKSKPLALEALSEIAILGGGNFVELNDLDDAAIALLTEIRKQSLKQ